MKTERRHDLETNSLAARMARLIEALTPHSGKLLAAVGVALALFAVSSIWGNYVAVEQQAAWDAYLLAYDRSDPELKGLQRLAEDEQYVGTPMQNWAYLVWADRQVLLAAQMYLFDRDGTKDRLRNVEGIFEKLAKDDRDRSIQDRARLGLARVYELQNKIDKAREQYATVQGDLRKVAERRAEQLEKTEVVDACDWLAVAKLPLPDATGGTGASGLRPSFDASLPKASAGGAAPRSLEDLLGDFGNEPADGRYSEDEAAQQDNNATPDDAATTDRGEEDTTAE